MEEIQKDFSWKNYLISVMLSEIITIFFTIKIALETRNVNDLSGLGVLFVWIPNNIIISIFSLYYFIRYKRYKSDGCNIFSKIANVIVSIISVILIGIGVYVLNLIIYYLVNSGFKTFLDIIMILPFAYLLSGIGLIFLVFKFKYWLLYGYFTELFI